MLKVTHKLIHLSCLLLHLSGTLPDRFNDHHVFPVFHICWGSWGNRNVGRLGGGLWVDGCSFSGWVLLSSPLYPPLQRAAHCRENGQDATDD